MSHGSPLSPLPNSEDEYAPSSWKDYLDYLHDSTDTQSPPAVCGYSAMVSGANSCYGAVYSPTQDTVYFAPHAGQGVSGKWCRVGCNGSEAELYASGTSGIESSAGYPYLDGCWAPKSDRILFTPGSQHSYMHYVDCKTGSIGMYGTSGASFPRGYYGGAYDPINDKVWLSPASGATGPAWPSVGASSLSTSWHPHGASGVYVSGTNAAYHGAVYSPSQRRVYYVPRCQVSRGTWQYADCLTSTIESYRHGVTGLGVSGLEYIGGAYDPVGDRVYFSPSSIPVDREWHYVDCKTGSVVPYDHGYTGKLTGRPFLGMVYSPLSRRMYLVPHQSSGVTGSWFYLDTSSNRLIPYPAPVGGVSASTYAGGVYSPGSNRVYFAPYGQAAQSTWHYIQETCSAPVPYDLAYSVAHLTDPLPYLVGLLEAEVSMLCVDGTDGKGGVFQLNAEFQDGVARNNLCSWSSSDNSVATVSQTGLVTAVSGKGAALGATVTISMSYLGRTGSCSVTVFDSIPSSTVDGAGLWLCKGGKGPAISGINTVYATFTAPVGPSTNVSTHLLVCSAIGVTDGDSYTLYDIRDQSKSWISPALGNASGTGRLTFYKSVAGTSTVDYTGYSLPASVAIESTTRFAVDKNGNYYNGAYYNTVVSSSSGNWGSIPGIVLHRMRSTTKKCVLFGDAGDSTSLAYANMLSRANMLRLYSPQNYVRYTNTTSRHNKTKILNMGTAGAPYDIVSGSVPDAWFSV